MGCSIPYTTADIELQTGSLPVCAVVD